MNANPQRTQTSFGRASSETAKSSSYLQNEVESFVSESSTTGSHKEIYRYFCLLLGVQ